METREEDKIIPDALTHIIIIFTLSWRCEIMFMIHMSDIMEHFRQHVLINHHVE